MNKTPIAVNDFVHGSISAQRGKPVEGLSEAAIKDLTNAGLIVFGDLGRIVEEAAPKGKSAALAAAAEAAEKDKAEALAAAEEAAAKDKAEALAAAAAAAEKDKAAALEKLAVEQKNKMAAEPRNKSKD